MGIFTDLFVNKEPYYTCSICNEKQTREKLNDGYICESCRRKCSAPNYLYPRDWHDMDLARVQRAMENFELLKIYQPNRMIKKYISFDDENRLFQLQESGPFYRYEELVSWALVQNNMSIIRGGIRKETDSTIAGSVMVPGRVYQFMIYFFTGNIAHPEAEIEFLWHGPIQYGDRQYMEYMRMARQILAELDKIVESIRLEEPVANSTLSGADEIRKYKSLLDEGILTPEEFEAKKKQILGL